MNIEELKAALKTEEGKAVLKEMSEGAIDALKEKNNELILASKVAKKERDEALAKIAEIESEKDDNDNAALKKSGDLEALEKKLMAKAELEKKALQDDRDKLQSILSKKTVDDSLTNALLANNIAKQHIPAIKALLKSEAKIETTIDDEGAKALIDGKDVSDYVKTWAEGSVGKHYIAADNNNGGGAKGSGSATQGSADLEKLNPKEKMNLGRAKQS
jgi:hypothetical protein